MESSSHQFTEYAGKTGKRVCAHMSLEEAYRFLMCIGPRGRAEMDSVNDRNKSATDIRLRFYKEQINAANPDRLGKHFKDIMYRKKDDLARIIMWSTEKLFMMLCNIDPETRQSVDAMNSQKCIRIRTSTTTLATMPSPIS